MDDFAMTDTPHPRPLVRALVLVLIAFLAGLAAMAWLLGRWPQGAKLLGVQPPTRIVIQRPAPRIVPVAPADVPGRIAMIETRLDRVDQASRAALGNADRAEGLLVAFAARRALDRGVALGYIEGLLRERFAPTQLRDVATVITVARKPVTLERLRSDFAQVAPVLAAAPLRDNWWQAAQRELGSLITVRRNGTPSTAPSERLQRARDGLEAGQVDVALAEVLRLPGQARAGAWIGEARRYVAARRALDAIETAALLGPQRSARAPEPTPAAPAL